VSENPFSLTIEEIINRSSSIVTGIRGSIRKPRTSLGIDPISLASAPIGKCARIDIDAFDDVSLLLMELLGFLRSLNEFAPSARQVFGVFEHRDEGVIIFLPTPRNANGLGPETGIIA
jgi:hypothetical protein